MNIVDMLDQQALRRPYAPAFVTPHEVISYRDTVDRVRRIAAALRERGIAEGDRVAVRLPNSPMQVLALLALARLGAVALPLPPQRPADQLQPLVARFELRATLGLRADAHAIAGTRFIAADDSLLASVDTRNGAPVPAEANAPGGAAPMTISLSSGTTGRPKAIARSHDFTLRLIERQRMRPQGPGVRMLVMMGFDATYANNTCLRILLSGGTLVVVPDVSLRSLALAIDQLGANHLLSTTALMSRLFEQLPADGQRFPGLLSCRLTGSRLPAAMVAQMQRRLTRHIGSDYGAAEVGALAESDRDGTDLTPGCVGHVMPWVQAQVVDEQDQPLATGSTGILRFRCDDFPTAYLDDPEASARVFRNGWFYPGDTGHLNADGTLVLSGRVDELINVGGTKVDPDEVEQVLLQDGNIVEAAAYGVLSAAGRPMLLAAVVCRGPVDEQETLARCHALLGQRAPQHLVRLQALPRNEAGKVLRRVLASRTRVSSKPAAAMAMRDAD